MYGFTALFLVLTMTGFSFYWVQRNRFDWFYYTHHLFIFVLLFICLNYSVSIVYLITGIALYSIDKLLAGLEKVKLFIKVKVSLKYRKVK